MNILPRIIIVEFLFNSYLIKNYFFYYQKTYKALLPYNVAYDKVSKPQYIRNVLLSLFITIQHKRDAIFLNGLISSITPGYK